MVYSCCKLVDAPDSAYVVGKDAYKFADKHLQCFNSDTAAFLLKRVEYGCQGNGYDSEF